MKSLHNPETPNTGIIHPEIHEYELDNFGDPAGCKQRLTFADREEIKDQPGQYDLRADGATDGEVLEVLAHRLEFLTQKYPCIEYFDAARAIQIALDNMNEVYRHRGPWFGTAEGVAKRATSRADEQRRLADKAKEIGGILYERWVSGHSSPTEIRNLIRKEKLEALGLNDPLNEDPTHYRVREYNPGEKLGKPRLTDAQFILLKPFLAKLPASAVYTFHEKFGLDGALITKKQLFVKGNWMEGRDKMEVSACLGDV